MITGFVNDDMDAVVDLTVCGPSGEQRQIQVVIDTGFNGQLTLPIALITDLGLRWRRRGKAVLADGSHTLFDIYEATMRWDGQDRKITVDHADTDPLAGLVAIQKLP